MSLSVLELTPAGAGGVSVIRVLGPGALERVRELGPNVRSDLGVPQLVRLRTGSEELDEALVCLLSPVEIELHVHGSPPLVERLVGLLTRSVAEHSTPLRRTAGEQNPGLSERVETLAWARLPRAGSESGARIVLDQAEGALRRELAALVDADAPTRAQAVRGLLARGRVARFAIEPSEVVLAGATNAGKSTLFNLLVGEERVIVSDEKGTTRDVVRERAAFGAYPVFLTDTAGWREAAGSRFGDVLARASRGSEVHAAIERESYAAIEHGSHEAIERESQVRARNAQRDADLVLCLVRADDADSHEVRADHADAHEVRADGADSHEMRAAIDPSRAAVPSLEEPASIRRNAAEPRVEVVLTQIDRIDSTRRAHFTDAISALREPERARARIQAIFHTAFELPREPWSPGRGVPFDAERMRGVSSLPLDARSAEWSRALERLLGPA